MAALFVNKWQKGVGPPLCCVKRGGGHLCVVGKEVEDTLSVVGKVAADTISEAVGAAVVADTTPYIGCEGGECSHPICGCSCLPLYGECGPALCDGCGPTLCGGGVPLLCCCD